MNCYVRPLLGLFVFIAFCTATNAQDTAQARQTMHLLSSPKMHGRGYVKDGALKAARYIAKEFEANSLEKGFESTYLGRFDMDVSTFPTKVQVKLGNKKLVPGVDYILTSTTGNWPKGEREIVTFTDNISPAPPNTWLLSPASGLETQMGKNYLERVASLGYIGLILPQTKLTWTAGDATSPIPIIEVRADALQDLDLTITCKVKQKDIKAYSGYNVIGHLPPTPLQESAQVVDSAVIICAHYDHLGRMGKETFFPGANDNASGIAMLLQIARASKDIQIRNRHLYFIAFGGEEAGLLGSTYYVNHPLYPLASTSLVINLDLMGNGQDGIMIVNAPAAPDELAFLNETNNKSSNLKAIHRRPNAANSDHYPFSQKGVKALFFYLEGKYPAYHDVYDTPNKPTLSGFAGAYTLLLALITEELK